MLWIFHCFWIEVYHNYLKEQADETGLDKKKGRLYEWESSWFVVITIQKAVTSSENNSQCIWMQALNKSTQHPGSGSAAGFFW